MLREDEKKIGVIMLHPDCNMRCLFCITDSKLGAMTFDQARRVLDRAQERGMDNVVLGGGEPSTWAPGVLRLAETAKARGMLVQIGTNGIDLPEGWETAAAVDRYVLPLESMEAGVHDAMRRMPKHRTQLSHHRIMLQRIDRLCAVGKAFTVSTVVTAENRDRLEALATFLCGLLEAGAPLHAWHLYRFIPAGRGGGKHADRLWISERDYHRACSRPRQICHGFHVYKRKDMCHSKTVDFFWVEDGRIVAGSEAWANRPAPRPSAEKASVCEAEVCL